MSPAWRTVAHDELLAGLVRWIDDAASAAKIADGSVVRVAVDGADCLGPAQLCADLVDPLHAAGRRAHLVRAADFWHDASLRLEHGHEDVDSYPYWLDAGALRREVLEPVGARHEYLPTLRDPASNRATREPPRAVSGGDVVLVGGEFLLGLGLPFERSIHLTAPAGALARRTAPDLQWTLTAHADYATAARPTELADVVIRCDRRHPVVTGLPC